jgi:heat shock protein HslJ
MTAPRLPRRAAAVLAVVAGCTSLAAPASAQDAGSPWTGTFLLSGTSWVVDELGGRPRILPVEAKGHPSLDFPADGGAIIHGCNQLGASLTSSGTALTFDDGGMTLMLCPGEAGELDDRLVKALRTTTAYPHDGEDLWLLNERGEAQLRLHRIAPPSDGRP